MRLSKKDFDALRMVDSGKTKIPRKKNPESPILRSILDYLAFVGVMAWRTQSVPAPLPGGGYRRFSGLKGVSDILGILEPSGRLLAVEVKTADGRLRKEQKEFIDAVNRRGGLAFVARSVGEVETALKKEGVIQ